MLARVHRFHGHNSLRPLYQKGKSLYAKNVKLLWSPSATKDYRVAVVVSKKVHKSAVVRNRIRRRVYEVTRKYYALSPTPHDLIFVVQNPSLATATSALVQDEIESLLKKIA